MAPPEVKALGQKEKIKGAEKTTSCGRTSGRTQDRIKARQRGISPPAPTQKTWRFRLAVLAA